LIERAKYECDIVFNDDREKILVLTEFISFLVNQLKLSELNTSPFFGTERERIVQKRSGLSDPHEALKRRSNEVAQGLLSEAHTFYDAASDKIEALIRIAAAANSMEYGVKGYSYNEDDFTHEFVHTLNEELHWNKKLIRSAITIRDRILYVTDNAGEILFDVFVIRKLLEMGKEVVVSPKSAPVVNDATIEDLKESGISLLEERCRIIPSGAYIGIALGEAEPDFLDVFIDERYLVLAKGMGNYESMSEFEAIPDLGLKGRLIYILRAKCEPVANSLGVRKGALVAKIVT
jgi:hypothetical protein